MLIDYDLTTIDCARYVATRESLTFSNVYLIDKIDPNVFSTVCLGTSKGLGFTTNEMNCFFYCYNKERSRSHHTKSK